ncbi:hypothetical protein FRC12_015152 [Ceratobasidium sp. 428]|nr:hypothetical protein FRC12_015152 [Ceratobasidium sp. 428]
MPSSRSDSRWDTYRWDSRQTPLDALNHWENRVKAKVTWELDYYRERNNRVVHTAMPVLSCDQYHIVGEELMPHLRRVCDDPRNAYSVAEQTLIEFLNRRGHALRQFSYQIGYDSGRCVVWVTSCVSRLEHLSIQSCTGYGGTAQEAKHNAAHMLLHGGHCMIRLS